MGIATFRRYRHLKARQAAEQNRLGVAAAFEAKRRASPGTPLPPGFINQRTYEALLASQVPYDCFEDLVGATVEELVRVPGIGTRTAEKIIEQVEAWQAAQESQEAGGEGDGTGEALEAAQAASGEALGGSSAEGQEE